MTNEERTKIYTSGDYRSLTDKQRRIFRNVVTDLDQRQMLRLTDLPVIASYAQSVVLARLACKDLEKRGLVLEEEDKYHGKRLKENPSYGIFRKAQSAIAQNAVLLGLTPTGRKRLKSEEVPPKSASEAWDEQED